MYLIKHMYHNYIEAVWCSLFRIRIRGMHNSALNLTLALNILYDTSWWEKY